MIVPLKSRGVQKIGNWQQVKFTNAPGQGLLLHIDKRCRKCGDTPHAGAVGWINLAQPYIYCHACFCQTAVWER